MGAWLDYRALTSSSHFCVASELTLSKAQGLAGLKAEGDLFAFVRSMLCT